MSLPNVVEPTWTWGSSAQIKLSSALGVQNSQQLAQVQLPEPAVCTLYMQASMTVVNNALATGLPPTVQVFTLNLNQGLGRITIPRQVAFSGQPSDRSPIEWTMPFVPLHALQVDVTALGFFPDLTPTGGEIDINIYFLIAPITRIPQKIQKLQFGMSLPGEADALDDELRTDLEDESPTTAEVMSQEADHRVHGVDGEDDYGDDDGGDEPQQAPAWMLELVDALAGRLGRMPKRSELRAAVKRMRERAARKAR